MSSKSHLLSDVLRYDGGEAFVKCYHCFSETPIYAPNSTQTFVCNCGVVYGTSISFERLSKPSAKKTKRKKHRASEESSADGDDQVDFKAESVQTNIESVIPLYSTCRFDTDYTVIGYALKNENNDPEAWWEEYVLLDASGKYMFLSMSYGHWVLLRECERPEQLNTDSQPQVFRHHNGHDYELFSDYEQNLMYACGELPYTLGEVPRTRVQEYISPPLMISHERCGDKHTFFNGTYLRQEQVRIAFSDLKLYMPPAEGVGSCQPFWGGIDYKLFVRWMLVLCIATLPIYMVASAWSEDKHLFTNFVSVDGSTVQSEAVVSSSFEVAGQFPSVVVIACSSSVFQDWIEGELTVVNEQTGEERTAIVVMEYYTGVDTDGYAWSEGSKSETVYIDRIEPGRYHVEAKFAVAPTHIGSTVTMSATQVQAWAWNYWLLVGLLGALTLVVGGSGYHFERVRKGLV